jgi:tRNA nucleotidyltransferase (CCA-adding enzyme)
MMRAMPAVAAAEMLGRLQARADTARVLSALDSGPNAYVVGGTVRDLLLDRDPFDLDVVIEGPLTPALRALGAPAREHEQFETATVTVGALRCDLARARAEAYPRPGALPDVRPASIEQDLLRRDFTINAIALGVSGARAGTFVSAPGATEDLAAGRIRVMHDDSFRDDPTRLLRLVRYGARLRFDVEPHTRALVADAVAGAALATVAGTRVGTELRLLGAEPDPVAALAGLTPLGLDAAIALGFGLDGPEPAADALALLPADGDRCALALAVAMARVPDRARGALMRRLGFEASQRDVILQTARLAPGLAAALRRVDVPSVIAAAVGPAPVEAVALAGALGAGAAATRWIEVLRSVTLTIGGADLLAAGVPAGPVVGAALRAALRAKLDGRASDRESELAEALRAVRAHDGQRSG